MLSGSEEYYCPYCNSLLNQQVGYDQDCGGWICQDCGQMLYYDDIFPGRKRCCDSCGDLLNKQTGFSSSNSTWTCRKCHHINILSDNKNADSADNKKNRAKKSARRNSVDAVDEVYQGDLFPGVMWHCRHCGALLNKQFGFNDYSSLWECAKCGHSNYIMDDEIQEMSEPGKAREKKEKTKDRNKTADNRTKRQESPRKTGSAPKNRFSLFHSPDRQSSFSRSRKTEQKHSLSEEQVSRIVAVCVFAVVLFFAGFGLFHGKKETPVDHTGEIQTSLSESSFKDKQYYDAVDAFSREGFTNIKLISSEPSGIFPSENQIEKITVNGSAIKYNEWYKTDAQICIYYKRFSRQERDAFDEKTNQSIRFGDLALRMPSYFVMDAGYEDYILFHDSQHKDTILKLFRQGRAVEWVNYQTHYPVDAGLMTGVPHNGRFTISIGKTNNVIRRITEYSFDVEGTGYVLFLSCPDSERTTYEGDLVKISQSAFVPGEMDIMLDVKMSDLLGKNYGEVYQYLASQGFTDIETQGMNDVVIGLFLQPGIVDKVLINGETDYKPGDWVKKDAEIVIMHHSNK